jgi:hypothetical protein
MEGPTSKKTKEPPKRANLKGNISSGNPSQEAYQIRKVGGAAGRQKNHLRGPTSKGT